MKACDRTHTLEYPGQEGQYLGHFQSYSLH